jgi:hypothetical protein
MEMLIVVGGVALFAIGGIIYFKYQDYKERKEKKQIA